MPLRRPTLLAALLALALAPSSPAAQAADPPLGVTGTVRFHADVPSAHVAPRHVEVWLPPQYDREPTVRFPVVYMHDGQNVFAPATSTHRIDWAVDETMTRLITEGKVRPAIVVAVWSTPARLAEYMPQKAVAAGQPIATGIAGMEPMKVDVVSDAYLRFLVQELKPLVDRTYRTRPGRDDTFVMGASMGGLISAYAVTEYPSVFGGAAAVSTHWPAAGGAVIDLLARTLPRPGTHRFYFDHGTATLDSLYAPFQARMDGVMRRAGYTAGRDWTTRAFPGADHSERAWRARAEEPLVFLLGAPRR